MTSIASNKVIRNISGIPSNYHCHRKLYKLVWGDYACPECSKCGMKFRDSYEWCPHCRKKFSVKKETFFRHSKLSYKTLWTLVWCWQNKWSISEVHKATNLSYLTIRKWYKKFRLQLPEDDTKLYGEVEADESFIGRLRFGHQQLVIGVIERHTRRIRLRIIRDRSRATIEHFIADTVEPGSMIATDALKSYNELYLLGYEHEDCNHELGIFGPTNHIENLWSVIKRQLRRIHNTLSFSYDDLKAILGEFELRHNHPELFYNVDNYLFCCSALLH